MSKFIFTISFLLGITAEETIGQKSPIQTDRPDQTECPFIVPKKYLQAENGILFERQNSNEINYSIPTILWKYGLTDNFEFRLISEVLVNKTGPEKAVGLAPVTFGFKANICEEKGLLPTISFIGHLTSKNWGSKNYSAKYAAPSFRFTLQHSLTNSISLGYNLGAEWDGETPVPKYLYTITTGFSLTDKIGCYVEAFGFCASGIRADNNIDGGLTWLISPNMLFDISGGLGISKKSAASYVALGFSYRLKVAK